MAVSGVENISEFEIPSFDSLKPTTSTQIFYLNGQINTSSLFWFMEMKYFKVSDHDFIFSIEAGKNAKKKDLIFPIGNKGEFLNSRYEKLVRGSKKKNGCFKNSITSDFSVGVKNVCVKIYPLTIHITGLKSIIQGSEAIDLVIKYFLELQEKITFKPEDKENLLKLNYHLDLCLKKIVSGNNPETYRLNIQEQEMIMKTCSKFVPVLNKILKNWIEIENVSNVLLFSEMLKNIDVNNFQICTEDLSIKIHNIAMINYNFRLGFKIKRDMLRKEFEKMPGMFVRYDKLSDHSVTIEVPYQKEILNNKKPKKVTCQTIKVYISGNVTQSGPGGIIMENLYQTFMEKIMDIKEKVLLQV